MTIDLDTTPRLHRGRKPAGFDKGKPRENVGRKGMGPRPAYLDIVMILVASLARAAQDSRAAKG